MKVITENVLWAIGYLHGYNHHSDSVFLNCSLSISSQTSRLNRTTIEFPNWRKIKENFEDYSCITCAKQVIHG